MIPLRLKCLHSLADMYRTFGGLEWFLDFVSLKDDQDSTSTSRVISSGWFVKALSYFVPAFRDTRGPVFECGISWDKNITCPNPLSFNPMSFEETQEIDFSAKKDLVETKNLEWKEKLSPSA